MLDYPAAHSMDTEWFGIDANGNIAIFDSGEGGAIPNSNYKLRQEAQLDGLDAFLLEMAKNNENRLLKLNIAGELVAKSLSLNECDRVVLSAGRIVGTPNGPQIKTDKPTGSPVLDGWLLHLACDDVISQLQIEENDYNYAVRFAGEATIVYVRECKIQTLQTLITEGKVLAGKLLRNYHNGLASLFGFFIYEHDDSGAQIPYTCIGKPLVPLCLDDLPEPLQDLVSWIWFDRLQFLDSEIIQPIEHMRCDTWGGNQWWVDTQGQTRKGHPYI
jgi:hypothetical protein